MEGEYETLRLDIKTDPRVVERQARWGGIGAGMRVADLGFGSGKTTECLHRLVQPGGEAVGVDIAKERVTYAKEHYLREGITYVWGDIREPMDHLGMFDFVWIRFVLEYHRSKSFEIVRNASNILKPGGILCLIDLDCNCLRSFGVPDRLVRTIAGLMGILEETADFDPYAGIKLYTYLYDLAFQEISVDVAPHNLIYGELNEFHAFNLTRKATAAGEKLGYDFEEYPGGFQEFFEELNKSFDNPRRFYYTSLITCRGKKPASASTALSR